MHNGHYVAYARTTAVTWHLFDDTDVKQARQVRGSCSVLLAFCKGARAKKDLAFGKLLAHVVLCVFWLRSVPSNKPGCVKRSALRCSVVSLFFPLCCCISVKASLLSDTSVAASRTKTEAKETEKKSTKYTWMAAKMGDKNRKRKSAQLFMMKQG